MVVKGCLGIGLRELVVIGGGMWRARGFLGRNGGPTRQRTVTLYHAASYELRLKEASISVGIHITANYLPL